MKANSKGSLAGCLVHLNASSTDRLAQQNLQIPEHASNRILSGRLFDAELSVRYRLTSSRPIANLITPLPTTLKLPNDPHLHQMSRSRQPNRDVCRPHKLKFSKREEHLVQVKYCEDTRPGHQLEASRKQHEIRCKRSEARKSSFIPSLLVSEAPFLPLILDSILMSSALIHKKP